LANAQQPTLQETREDLFGLLGIFPNMKKKGDEGGKGLGTVGAGKRALTEESPEDLFGLLGIFPNKKNNEDAKGVNLICPRSAACPDKNLMHVDGQMCEVACVSPRNVARKKRAGWKCGPC
jgi:hypothetical protein